MWLTVELVGPAWLWESEVRIRKGAVSGLAFSHSRHQNLSGLEDQTINQMRSTELIQMDRVNQKGLPEIFPTTTTAGIPNLLVSIFFTFRFIVIFQSGIWSLGGWPPAQFCWSEQGWPPASRLPSLQSLYLDFRFWKNISTLIFEKGFW